MNQANAHILWRCNTKKSSLSLYANYCRIFWCIRNLFWRLTGWRIQVHEHLYATDKWSAYKKWNASNEVGNKTVWIIVKPHSTGGRPKSVLRNRSKVCNITIKNNQGGSIFYVLSTALKSVIRISVKFFSIFTGTGETGGRWNTR